ncbi:hypothetical protein ABIF65_004166 [Bradyrhizobium japonicum]|nr:hypothetical protein [Bradyrhizobium japonicum]MCP1779181.1 hypothetical protein [Bradyrhizobium japonicum]MCP1889317.1 hypothetical protein [Bradyrhizobium japonicum]MCP1957823.1 hypothetical protein [Bradyrhizobium japonicum]MCW2322295.1 hypothetical protein [Bradyrhizobium japonicum]
MLAERATHRVLRLPEAPVLPAPDWSLLFGPPTEAALVPADWLKSIEPGCAFPKLYRAPVYKQLGSLPSFRLVLHHNINSERYVPRAID